MGATVVGPTSSCLAGASVMAIPPASGGVGASDAVLAVSGLAMAQGWGGGPGMGRGPGMGMGYGPYDPGYGPRGQGYGPGAWGPGLNLTPEQTQKMQTLRDSFFKETIPLRNEMMVKKLELRTLWAQAKPEQEKILAKQKEINALRAQFQEMATKHRLAVRNVLTPEQQAQVGSLWGGGFGPGYGMRGGFGPGRGMGPGSCGRW